MRQEIAELRALTNEVARLLEKGAPLTGDELLEVGSIAGTLRARLQHYRPQKAA